MKDLSEVAQSSSVAPFAKTLDALLGPKIERLRKWSYDRDLKGRIQPEALAQECEKYFRDIAARVSKITSIAFQALKLDINKAYEPLTLQKAGPSSGDSCDGSIGQAHVGG